MKKTILILAAAALLTAACGTKQQDNATSETAAATDIKNVEGRTNMGAKLYVTPQPALMIATYDQDGTPDVMMAAWGSQCASDRVCFMLSKHRTTDNLRLHRAFTLSYADARTVVQSDYFGSVSGYDVPDKVARAGFTVTKSPNVNAPIINEYPVTMECRVVEMSENEDGSSFVIGEIVNASADTSVLTDGRIDIRKLNPLAWDAASLNYFTLGDSVGRAWTSGMKLK